MTTCQAAADRPLPELPDDGAFSSAPESTQVDYSCKGNTQSHMPSPKIKYQSCEFLLISGLLLRRMTLEHISQSRYKTAQ